MTRIATIALLVLSLIAASSPQSVKGPIQRGTVIPKRTAGGGADPIAVSEAVAEIVSTSNTSTYAFGSFTPEPNATLVILAFANASVGAGLILNTSGTALQWVKETSTTFNAGADSAYVFWANTPASTSASVYTISLSGDAGTGCIAYMFSFTNSDLVTPNPIKQVVLNTDPAAANANGDFTDSLTTTNGYCAAWAGELSSSNPADVSAPPSNWTEVGDNGHSAPTANASGAYRAGGETGTNVAFTNAETDWAFSAVEVYQEGAGPAGTFLTKVGSFVANTSTGSQAITGVGFMPKAVILWGGHATSTGYTATSQLAIGMATAATARGAVAWDDEDAQVTIDNGRNSSTTTCYRTMTTTTAVDSAADFTSFDSDGFTINWSDAPASAIIVNYIALGGTAIINAKVGNSLTGTSAGSKSITGVGFRGNFLFVFSGFDLGAGSHVPFSLGVTDGTNQASSFFKSQDGVVLSETSRYQRSSQFFSTPIPATADAIDMEASFTSFSDDGFVMDITDAPAADTRFVYLVIQGGLSKVGVETQATSVTTKDTSGISFNPTGGFFFGVSAIANSSLDTGDAKIWFGASDGSNNAVVHAHSVDGVAPSQTEMRILTPSSGNKCISHSTADGTTNAEASCTFGSGKFTMNWTTADSTAREFVYVVFAPRS